ncbi:MAG: AIR synthase family protein [Stenotrophomonas maltophilia]
MELGKFPPQLLERLLGQIPATDPQVLIGPGIGEDAAVISWGDKLLVAKSDPITFATDMAGWYAVQVNANDVACTGGIPKWFLATLLVPQGFSETDAEGLFRQILDACAALGISLVGGHSEVTLGIDRPIVLGSMLGEVEPDRLVRTGGAQEGDSIVITKGVALEGTAILARDQAVELRRAGVGEEAIQRAAVFLTDPGISVVNDARIAAEAARIHSFHDPTEGGLFTGLREVAKASDLGLAIEEGSIPVLPETELICRALGLNPFGLLASGALLITLPAGDVPALLGQLEQGGISGWEVGQMIAREEGLTLFGREGEVPLPEFDRDELARYLANQA